MTRIPPNCATLLARGFAIFPVQHKGKKPLSSHGFKDASRNTEQIEAWSREFPHCNWGVACGAQSACIVIDFDKPEALEMFERQHEKLPRTYTVKTARGVHFYFRNVPEGMFTRKFDGGEIRADGAYVVAEGSIHPTGAEYECVCDVEMADFPSALLTHFRSEPGIKVGPDALIAEGQRNDSLFHLAVTAARGGASENAILALLRAENTRCAPPLLESELGAIVKGAVRYVSRTGGRRKRIDTVAGAHEPATKHAQQVAAVETPPVREFPGSNGVPEWKQQSVELCTVLDDTFAFIRRFVSLSRSQTRVVALWIVHTHVFAAADATPYLAINSPEKQSGKTRLLEVCQPLVANEWMTGRVSAAVLTRKIDAVQPTLLLDESDAAFSAEKEYAEALRGVLNTGHRRGGKASCCIGQGAAIGFKDFSTFCPKAIAGIGALPDTVADRSVPIRLKRAASDEKIDRFRLRDVEAETTGLRERMGAWAIETIEILKNSRPTLPSELTDRQQDGAEPLLAIADLAGGDWPEDARRALIELCADAQASDESIGVRLLSDIRDVFKDLGVDRLSSADTASALADIETSPWGEWGKSGKPLSAAKLARLLRPYSIVPDTVRIGDKTPKGYKLEDFQDAFKRYLRPEAAPVPPLPDVQTATTPQSNTGAGPSGFSKCNTDAVLHFKKREIANKTGPRGGVAVSNVPTEEEL